MVGVHPPGPRRRPGKDAGGAAEAELFVEPVGDLVGIDGQVVLEVDHGLEGHVGVGQEVAGLAEGDRADVLPPGDAMAGGDGFAGHVDVEHHRWLRSERSERLETSGGQVRWFRDGLGYRLALLNHRGVAEQ
ncbi:MAG: hypothetical protein WBQ50_07450, partial [Nocardioides sp.]